jgi:hypothetical protein
MAQMQTTAKQMRGSSIMGTLFIIIVVLIDVIIAIKLIPTYLDNYQMKSALKEMAQDSTMMDLTRDELRDLFLRRLETSNIKDFDINKLQIDRKKGKLKFSLDYDARVHLLGNIDAVLTFTNRVESE